MLDSLTMEWRQPKIEGDPIGVRTRHTAVAVHADYDEHERGERLTVDVAPFCSAFIASVHVLESFCFRRIFRAPFGPTVVSEDH